MKEEIIETFERRFTIQQERLEKLESQVQVQANLIEKLEVKCDDSQQYSRRSSVRVYGVEKESGDESETILEMKIKECYTEIQIPYEKNEIDRFHRIGPIYKQDGKTYQAIIVKFRSWEARQKFYEGRHRRYIKGVKKIPGVKFTVSLDLTRRRYLLLQEAREYCKNHDNVDYVNVNCSLAIKFKDNKIHYFNSNLELFKLLPNETE